MDNIINELKKIKILLSIVETKVTQSGGIGDNITYTPQQFKEMLDKVDDLLEENDRLKKDVAFWHNESDVHFEDLCKRGEQIREVVDKACKSFCDTLCPNECRLKGGICPFENQFRESMKRALEE